MIIDAQRTGRGVRYTRDSPRTAAEAAEAGRHWPGGLTHGGRPPQRLRDLLTTTPPRHQEDA